MGLVSRVLRRTLWLLVDLTVVLLVIVLLPGLPPHVTYSTNERLPSPLPLEGALAKNSKLNSVERILDGKIRGPESIASRKPDEIFVSLHGGKILKLWGPRFDHFKLVTSIGPGCDGPWQEEVCGRPLGLRFAPDGRLLVADAYLGLFSVDVETGEKMSLFDITQEIDGAVPKIPDDLDVDKEGNIYWSDASTVAPLNEAIIEMLSSPSGRILKFDSRTGINTVLVRNINFANGMQLSPDQDFLLFSETSKFRVLRHWLHGPKAGQTEIFVDRLPGYPDNIRAKEDGGYYISLVSYITERNFQFSSALGSLPSVRKLILRLLAITKLHFQTINKIFPSKHIEQLAFKTLHLEPLGNANLRETNMTIVVEVDADGNIVDSLQGDSGRIVFISETQKVGDNLFFGSPFNTYLGRLSLAPLSMEVEGKSVRMKEVTGEKTSEEIKEQEPDQSSAKESVENKVVKEPSEDKDGQGEMDAEKQKKGKLQEETMKEIKAKEEQKEGDRIKEEL